MTVFVSKYDGHILFRARAEGPGAVGDLVVEIKPGESAFGKAYEEWTALPSGRHDIGTP